MESSEYQELFQLAPDAILVLDPTGIVIDANDEATRFLGQSRDDLIGKSVVGTVAPEDKDESARRLADVSRGVDNQPARRIFIRKDGSRVPGEILATTLHDSDGSPRRIVSVIRDASRSVTDERMREEQAARLQALGSVASGVAHDFNNILATIIGYSELAREQVDPESTIARDLDRSIRAADQARQLAEQILAFGRQVDGGERAFDVEQAIVGVTRLVRSLLPAGADLQVESDHSRALVFGDMARFQQVIMNLCANAGRAIGDRGGTVCISVGTSDKSEFDQVIVTVADDGPGVPPDLRDRIFDPFFTTRSGSAGTGLGLSLVRSIVESFGGSVALDDAPIGASFTVRIPAFSGDEIAASEPAGNVVRPGSGTVLVVDDDRELAEVLARVLTGAGYRVMATSDPNEALQLARTWTHEISLILSDHNMPGMDGVEFLRRVRSDGCSAPALMLSAFRPELDEAVRRELVVHEVLAKPVLASMLAQSAAAAIEGSHGDDRCH